MRISFPATVVVDFEDDISPKAYIIDEHGKAVCSVHKRQAEQVVAYLRKPLDDVRINISRTSGAGGGPAK